jgi:hypothetical protein
MYCDINFKTKKAMKEALAAGRKFGIYQPNNIFNTPTPTEGTHCVEGPHYPAPHSWYASVKLANGVVVSVK